MKFRLNKMVLKTLPMYRNINNCHALADTLLHFEEVDFFFFLAFCLHFAFAVFRLSSEQPSLHPSTRIQSSRDLSLFSLSHRAVFFSFVFNFENALFSFDGFGGGDVEEVSTPTGPVPLAAFHRSHMDLLVVWFDMVSHSGFVPSWVH